MVDERESTLLQFIICNLLWIVSHQPIFGSNMQFETSIIHSNFIRKSKFSFDCIPFRSS